MTNIVTCIIISTAVRVQPYLAQGVAGALSAAAPAAVYD